MGDPGVDSRVARLGASATGGSRFNTRSLTLVSLASSNALKLKITLFDDKKSKTRFV